MADWFADFISVWGKSCVEFLFCVNICKKDVTTTPASGGHIDVAVGLTNKAIFRVLCVRYSQCIDSNMNSFKVQPAAPTRKIISNCPRLMECYFSASAYSVVRTKYVYVLRRVDAILFTFARVFVERSESTRPCHECDTPISQKSRVSVSFFAVVCFATFRV